MGDKLMSEPRPTPGPWGFEVMPCENTYGEGDDAQEGYNAYAIVDTQGRVLFDSLNRDDRTSLIKEDHDQDGRHAWDAQARVDVRLAAAAWDLLEALKRIAEHTDPDSPEENYRADDTEGCLDTVFSIAKRAIAAATKG
jgi:hypothetical protein